MARYLIGTAFTQTGRIKKHQPADKFRKLLLQQKISFRERLLDPMHDRIDLELKNKCWDREQKTFFRKKLPTYRERTSVDLYPAYEFTFDEGDLT